MSRTTLDKAMTEDSLLLGVTEALTLYGWMWTHHRRSDRALLMGQRGFPDILAVRGDDLLALELKSTYGTIAVVQKAWANALSSAGVECWIVRPANYDALLERLR